MTEINQIYKCEVCGNIVEMIHSGAGILVCCGKDMNLLKENIVDAAVEKHVPVIEESEDGIMVKVGEVAHPMEVEHFIEWIEVLSEDKVYRMHLEPGQEPSALFPVKYSNNLIARAYCNLHSLWATNGANVVVTDEDLLEDNKALVN